MEMILEYLKSVLFGIVQGITEWLPISSTGHLILLNQFTPLTVAADPARNQEFFDMFKVLIQFGSILAVVVLYFHKLNPFSPKKTQREKKNTFSLWGKVLVASVPAGIIGILFNDTIDSVLSAHRRVPDAGADPGHLAVGRYHSRRRIPGLFPFCGRGVFLLPGDSRHAGGQRREDPHFPGEGRRFLRLRAGHSAGRHAGFLYCVYVCDPFPDGLYQKARFQGFRMVPHRFRRRGGAVFCPIRRADDAGVIFSDASIF